MEKFGIFELMDALSAIVSAETPTDDSAPQTTGTPTAQDAAFDPPSYGEEKRDEGPSGQRDALSSFLSRHDNLSKKIDGEK